MREEYSDLAALVDDQRLGLPEAIAAGDQRREAARIEAERLEREAREKAEREAYEAAERERREREAEEQRRKLEQLTKTALFHGLGSKDDRKMAAKAQRKRHE